MKWIHDLSTRTKLLFGFGIILALAAGALLLALQVIHQLEADDDQLIGVYFQNSTDLQDLESNLGDGQTALLTVVCTVDNAITQANLLELRNGEIETVHLLEDLISRNANDVKLRRRIEEYQAQRTGCMKQVNEDILPLVSANKIDEARALVLGAHLTRFNALRAMLIGLTDDAQNAAKGAESVSKANADSKVLRVEIIGIAAVTLAVFVIAYLNNLIARPLAGITELAKKITAGDLTVEPPHTTRKDEIGVLSENFREMTRSLRRVNQDVQEGINVLSSASSEILSTIAQGVSSASETAAAVGETATSVEEVRQTAQVTSQKARAVAEGAQSAVEISQAGQKAVDASVEGMGRIREQMDFIAQTIVHLSEQSQAIGEIIASVNELAEQSNLLAVNASIEAAKAGEHGRGFAVVADEIKRMSEQSKQATTRVRTILGEVQKAVSTAVLATEKGGAAAEAGVRQSGESGEAIARLVENINESAQAAVQIAASSQEQLVGMDQMVQAMNDIKLGTAQNVSNGRQIEVAAENLKALGAKLRELVSNYKV